MDADQVAIAQKCLDGSQDGSMSFPAIIGALMAAGFDGYAVDYRAGSSSFYRPDGNSCVLANTPVPVPVAPLFDAAAVAALIRWAQSAAADYSYQAFSEKVKAAGCAGYIVSFPGRRVLYYGRTAETHIELFPQ